jgi:hypothetical protein
MVQQCIGVGLPIVQGLLQRIENEVRALGLSGSPAHNASRIGIDLEGHIPLALPVRDISEVLHPRLVRPVRLELPLHAIWRAARSAIGSSRSHRLAPHRVL